MNLKLHAFTLNSSRPEEMVRFYSAFGLNFHQVKVKEGSQFFRGELSNLEINIFGMLDKKAPLNPVLQLSIQVDNLELICTQLRSTGLDFILDPGEYKDGKRAIICDPEGNTVELLESSAV